MVITHKKSGKKETDQRRIERNAGAMELTGVASMRNQRYTDGKDADGREIKLRTYPISDTSYEKGNRAANIVNRLQIANIIDPGIGEQPSDKDIEKDRFRYMGIARELIHAGVDGGNPTYVVAGAKLYDKLGVNADSVIRKSLRQSLDRMNVQDTSSERVRGDVFGNSTSIRDNEYEEARDMLSKYEAKHSANIQRITVGILSIIGFSGGIIFLGSQLTGNVVGSVPNFTPIFNFVGVGLFLLGIISFFAYLKDKRLFF